MLTCTFIFWLSLLGDLSFYIVLLTPVCGFGVGSFRLVGGLGFFFNEKRNDISKHHIIQELKSLPCGRKNCSLLTICQEKKVFYMHISSHLLICSFQLVVVRQMFVAVGVPGDYQGKMANHQLSSGVSSITGSLGGRGGRVDGFCEGMMTPQLASEPFGNVWLLRKVLDWCMGKAGQAHCSQRSWWHSILEWGLCYLQVGVSPCSARPCRWALPWGPCPFLG